MESTKKSTWVGGTAVLAVVILALAWFVLISPVVDDTATAADDTKAAEDRNAALVAQLDRLKQQYENLGEYKNQLAELSTEIPAAHETADFLRLLDRLAVEAGTNIVGLEFATPADVVPAVPLTPAVEEAPSDESTSEDGEASDDAEATDDSAAADAAPATGAPAVIPGFVAVPVSITVLSNTPSTITFLGSLQRQTERLFLVTAISGEGQGAEEGTGGRPATVRGDAEVIITGYLYVLQDDSVVAPEEGDGTEPDPVAPPAGDGSGAFSSL